MHDDTLTLLTVADVAAQLAGQERALIDLAAEAYCTHARGESRLPTSEYLRFPGMERERIIPKAGYLGGAHPACGIKWIASFPDNVARGMPRASALIILNSLETGRPTTVMEGSLISGQRTAAGAALAARHLHARARVDCLGLIGCGPINMETLRFILADSRPVAAIRIFDLDAARVATSIAAVKAAGFPGPVTAAATAAEIMADCDLISIATSAVKPSLDSLDACQPDATILHISLRDFTPEVILAADNVVDDADHILQANTALHVAQQQTGRRDFIRATLADVVEGRAPARAPGKISLFSPFGLAALDLAFAEFVQRRCRETGAGTRIPHFLP